MTDSPKAQSSKTDQTDKPAGWRQYKQEITFLTLFLVLLGGGFTLLSLNWVNSAFVDPFTMGVAKTSGAVLNLVGQNVTMKGTQVFGSKFAVDIMNGCNGLETVIIFVSAVLSFPAPIKARLIGLALGVVAIQFVNLIRVVALFLTGSYFPALFDSSHTVIWQTIVIAFGVLLWMFWANKFAAPERPDAEPTGAQA